MKHAFAALAVILLIGAGCNTQTSTNTSMEVGTTSTGDSMNNTQMNNSESGEQKSDVTFMVDAGNFSFSPNRLEVKKGQRVTIILDNTQGFHDLVIDEFDARTEQVQAGQKTSITFVADKVGEFEYYCSVGTHRQMGMVGKLVVLDNSMSTAENAMAEKSNDSMEKETTETMTAGTYEDYADSKLSLANSGKVVLFFKASWCPTCKAFDADVMSKLTSVPEDVHILKVNYDNSDDLKKKYGVTYQHTFVQVDAQGNIIAKWSGSPTLDSFLTQLK